MKINISKLEELLEVGVAYNELEEIANIAPENFGYIEKYSFEIGKLIKLGASWSDFSELAKNNLTTLSTILELNYNIYHLLTAEAPWSDLLGLAKNFPDKFSLFVGRSDDVIIQHENGLSWQQLFKKAKDDTNTFIKPVDTDSGALDLLREMLTPSELSTLAQQDPSTFSRILKDKKRLEAFHKASFPKADLSYLALHKPDFCLAFFDIGNDVPRIVEENIISWVELFDLAKISPNLRVFYPTIWNYDNFKVIKASGIPLSALSELMIKDESLYEEVLQNPNHAWVKEFLRELNIKERTFTKGAGMGFFKEMGYQQDVGGCVGAYLKGKDIGAFMRVCKSTNDGAKQAYLKEKNRITDLEKTSGTEIQTESENSFKLKP